MKVGSTTISEFIANQLPQGCMSDVACSKIVSLGSKLVNNSSDQSITLGPLQEWEENYPGSTQIFCISQGANKTCGELNVQQIGKAKDMPEYFKGAYSFGLNFTNKTIDCTIFPNEISKYSSSSFPYSITCENSTGVEVVQTSQFREWVPYALFGAAALYAAAKAVPLVVKVCKRTFAKADGAVAKSQ